MLCALQCKFPAGFFHPVSSTRDGCAAQRQQLGHCMHNLASMLPGHRTVTPLLSTVSMAKTGQFTVMFQGVWAVGPAAAAALHRSQQQASAAGSDTCPAVSTVGSAYYGPKLRLQSRAAELTVPHMCYAERVHVG
jgi:hypothetical protein